VPYSARRQECGGELLGEEKDRSKSLPPNPPKKKKGQDRRTFIRKNVHQKTPAFERKGDCRFAEKKGQIERGTQSAITKELLTVRHSLTVGEPSKKQKNGARKHNNKDPS